MQGDIFAKLFCYFAFPPSFSSFLCQLLTYSIKFSEVPKGHIKNKKRTEVSEMRLILQILTMKRVILKRAALPLQALYDSSVKFSRQLKYIPQSSQT